MSTVLSIVGALIVLSVLVTVHEFGHYLAGRKLGFTILEFSVGMGPLLLKKEKDGIQYSLRALPIGGMCRFYGEDQEVKDGRCFNAQPVWKRIVTVAAGPVMNILLAILLSMITLVAYGDFVPAVYECASETSPAAVAGMEAGDVLVAVDGKRITYYDEAVTMILAADPAKAVVTVERDGESLDLTVRDFYDQASGKNLIGITISPVRVKYGFFQSIGQSFRYLWTMVRETFAFFGNAFRGQVQSTDVAGPVGIITLLGEAVRSSFETVLRFGMMISISLAIMNLLPLPALDGGRIAFMVVEAVRGKAIPPEKEGMVHFVGIVLLFGLIIFLTYNDISNIARGVF